VHIHIAFAAGADGADVAAGVAAYAACVYVLPVGESGVGGQGFDFLGAEEAGALEVGFARPCGVFGFPKELVVYQGVSLGAGKAAVIFLALAWQPDDI